VKKRIISEMYIGRKHDGATITMQLLRCEGGRLLIERKKGGRQCLFSPNAKSRWRTINLSNGANKTWLLEFVLTTIKNRRRNKMWEALLTRGRGESQVCATGRCRDEKS